MGDVEDRHVVAACKPKDEVVGHMLHKNLNVYSVIIGHLQLFIFYSIEIVPTFLQNWLYHVSMDYHLYSYSSHVFFGRNPLEESNGHLTGGVHSELPSHCCRCICSCNRFTHSVGSSYN